MQVLANALPGVRDVRGPVIAGYLWLLFAWLIVDPDFNRRPKDRLGAAVFDLGHDLGHIGIAIAVSVAAYLVGSVSQVVSAPVSHWASAMRNPFSVVLDWLAEIVPAVGGGKNPYGETVPADVELRELAENFAFESGLGGLGKPEESDERDRRERALQGRLQRAHLEAEREVTLPATLLVGKEPELFAEVDRLRSEGELRLSVVLPLGAILLLVSLQDSLWWLLGWPFVVVLLRDGVRRDQDSRRLIADAQSQGLIKSSAVERFRDWISDQERERASAPTQDRELRDA